MSSVRPALAALLFLATVLAGCADGGPAPLEKSSAPPSRVDVAPEANETSIAVGAIAGRILNDEGLPLNKVRVAMVEEGAEVETGDDGTFEFRNVPIGTHTIVANRVGYDQAQARLNVDAGQTSELELILAGLVIAEAFHENLPFTAYHHTGNAQIDYYLTSVSDSQCEGCSWNFQTRGVPQEALLEIQGRHTVSSPQGDKEHVELCWGNRTAGACPWPDVMIYGQMALPMSERVSQEKIAGNSEFHLDVFCELQWVCVEERRDIWFTAFHHQAMPDSYTAFPV